MWPQQIISTTGVAVEGKQVDGTAGNARDGVLGSERLDTAAESARAARTLKSVEVGTETGDMRCGHGSSRDGVLQNTESISREH